VNELGTLIGGRERPAAVQSQPSPTTSLLQ